MKINKLIGISILTAGCLVFHSCNEEWDKWETIQLEATSSFENSTEVDYQPSSLRIDIKCNGEWSVEVPAWMSTDIPSGTGDAQVTVTIRENDTKKARTGSIRIQSRAHRQYSRNGLEELQSHTTSQIRSHRACRTVGQHHPYQGKRCHIPL